MRSEGRPATPTLGTGPGAVCLTMLVGAMASACAIPRLRPANPVRTTDGTNAPISIERVQENTKIKWRIVTMEDALSNAPQKTVSSASSMVAISQDLSGASGSLTPLGSWPRS